MARAIERIEQDIEALEAAISALAGDLETTYTAYLTTLGQALRQQLILASYHLCTQGYPENFLHLSLNQRQKLQQELRKLGTQAAERLLSYTKSEAETSDSTGEEVAVALNAEAATELPLIEHVSIDLSDDLSLVEMSLGREISSFEIEELDIEDDIEDEIEDDDEDISDSDEEDEEEEEEDEKPKEVKTKEKESNSIPPRIQFSRINPTVPLRFSAINPSSPIELTKWQQSIELATQYALKKVSREANILLQKATILPKKIPAPILEAAVAASEASSEVMPGPPNLVNMLIEIDNQQLRHGSSKVTQLMAINLRLGEIEFAESALSSKRNQIRNFLTQLQKLRRDYQKKQREHAIVEAESAWRASWYEDS